MKKALTRVGYVVNIERESLKNKYFRKVLHTTSRVQLVVMSLKPLEDIGAEVHKLDQFIRVEGGAGMSVLDGKKCKLVAGSAVIVPAGVNHNIINTSRKKPLKVYTVYAPPNHRDGTVHKTKADAQKDEGEHYEG